MTGTNSSAVDTLWDGEAPFDGDIWNEDGIASKANTTLFSGTPSRGRGAIANPEFSATIRQLEGTSVGQAKGASSTYRDVAPAPTYADVSPSAEVRSNCTVPTISINEITIHECSVTL